MWLNIKRVALGCFISCILSCILTGGPDGLVVIGLAVVCTAGIALVVLVPVWWLIGLGSTLLVQHLRHQADDSKDAAAATGESVSQAERALIHWIEAAYRCGETTESMTQYLLDMGWSAEQIRTARSRIQAQPAKS